MIGSPEFIITNIKDLNSFSNYNITSNSLSNIKQVEVTEINQITSFTEYVTKANKYVTYSQDDSSFILTSKDIKLISLEHTFGEEFQSPVIKITLSDPEKKFEHSLLKASIEAAKALNNETKRLYIAFGIGDDLRYWSNFLEGSLVMVKRTQDHLSTKNLYLEFIPAFGITDLFSSKIKSSFENNQDTIGNFEYKVYLNSPKIVEYENDQYLHSTILSPVLLKKARTKETIDQVNSNNIAKYLYLSLFGDYNKEFITTDTLIGKCISSTYNTKNIIFVFSENPLNKIVYEEFIKSEFDNSDFSIKNIFSKPQSINPRLVDTIKRSYSILNSQTLTSLQLSHVVETISDEYKLRLNLTVKFKEIEKYLKNLVQVFSKYKDDSTPILFLKENDTSLLKVWYSAGLIANSTDTCVILGDEKAILSQLYGVSIEGGQSPFFSSLKKLSSFDNTVYGMLEGIESKFLENFRGLHSTIKDNNIPILKFNQKISNVVSLEVDDNYAYFNALLSKINMLANYSSFKTSLSEDINMRQYTKDNLVGFFSYFKEFYQDGVVSRNYSSQSLNDLSKQQAAFLSLSDITKLQQGFIEYASKDKDLQFINYLKSGDLGSAKSYFRENFVFFNVSNWSDLTYINKAKPFESPTIIIDPKDYESKQDVENFIDTFFSVVFDKLINDQQLVYYIEHEIGDNPASYELYMYKDIYNKAFKLTVGALPMYKLCNLSYLLVPALFLYNESNIVGDVNESELLTGFYKITGIKHTLSPEEMKTTFILRKTFGEFYGDNRSTSS